MADSEKGNSSTGKDKGKVSKIDDDISKDFLSSWKSMSMAGGDDMDFNFEPVTKGNKKAFDFDKLDMDFSLDGSFGKISSFKMDMPDLDFSNSPKKSTKSKETSELESRKGRLSSKNSDFSFSFDFNGMDDFSLDGPSNKGGKSPSREKSKSSKEVCSSKEMECEDLPKQADNDDGKATEKTHPISENATNSISENLIDSNKNFDASLVNFAPTSSIEVDTLQTEETQICTERILSGDVLETGQRHHHTDRTSVTKESLLESASVTDPVELEDSKKSSSMEKTPTVKGVDEEVETVRDDKVQTEKGGSMLFKPPTVSTLSDEVENSSVNVRQNDISEACTRNGQLLGGGGEKLKPDKPSPECYMDKMNVEYGENKTLVDGNESNGKLTSDSMNPSVINASEALDNETRSKAETQRSASKVFASPFGSGSTLAKPTLLAYKVSGSYNPKFPRVDNTKQGVKANLSVMQMKDKGSTHSSAAGDRSENDGKNIDNISSSSTKEVVNPNSVTKSSEKNADVDTLSSGEAKNNVKQNTHSVMSIDVVPQDRQAMKDQHFVPGNEKKIQDAKSSSFAVPLRALSLQESKFDKQISTTFKDKMPGIVSIQKSKITETNKLPSLTIGKKLSGFPSSKSSVNIAMTKHSASPVGENAKSMGTLGNRFQAKSKTTPTVASDTLRSSPSLKRKPSEVAVEGSRNPHPPKRLSPDDRRMPKGLSPGKAKEVHTKGSLLDGSAKNVTVDHSASKFDFQLERSMEDFSLTSLLESDENVEKAEACAKELDDICNMLKKKQEEAKELLVRALVNNNNLLMLNHPIYEEKIHAVQRFANRLMSK